MAGSRAGAGRRGAGVMVSGAPHPYAEGAPDRRYANPDLLPTDTGEFRWRWWDFAAIWVCVSWSLAYLMLSGMPGQDRFTWPQTLLICGIAQVVVLLPSFLVEHAGDRYGVPFAVFARSAFGVRGAALPALLRFVSACVFFGFQADLGVQGIQLLTGGLGDSDSGGFFSPAYLVFLALQLWIITKGPNGLRRFADLAAPVLIVGLIVALLWASAHGEGPVLPEPARPIGWGADFWLAAAPALASATALFAAVGLTVPDLVHLGSSGRRAEGSGSRLGVGLLLPVLMTGILLYTMALMSMSGYGRDGYSGSLTLHALSGMPGGSLVAATMLIVATLCGNLGLNLVSAGYDLSSTAPSVLGFRGAAVLAALAGTAVAWWARSSSAYEVLSWASLAEGFFGTVSGILVVEYWIVRRTRLRPADLYRAGGPYWYTGGWNWRAVVAFLAGGVLAVGGSSEGAGAGADGPLLPFLSPLDDFGWLVGLVVAGGLYALLTLRGRPARAGD
ncbi:cytosine permease [Streptomyces sp. NRRL F-5727]|uniref:cytosine permease n=1 Tax=Streptomyces sp. NRRL F-5727 TaxID=1463871 RepID=UPI00055B1E5B|nr:cytosine permease [Streptomyces sp. NRRL F-5727]